MARRYGRAPRGERLRAGVSHGHWETTTFVAGLSRTGMIAPWVLDGPMNGDAFPTYATGVLVPELSRGNVVIMDNYPVIRLRPCAPPSKPQVPGSCSFRPRPPPGQALQPGLQHRDGLLKIEGTPAKGGRADHPRSL